MTDPQPPSKTRPLNLDCLVGSGETCELQDLGRFTDRSGLIGEVSVLRCRACGLGISQPPLEDVAFLYADRTSQDFQPDTGAVARLIKGIAFRYGSRRLLADVGNSPRLIVDFACGSGLFTHALAKTVRGSRVIGMDFHDDPPVALGEVEYAPVGRIGDLEGTADLVLAMHVLEHDDHPRALLAKIATLVRPGGCLVVETPNIDCVWIRVFGHFWDAWYLPYHRRHFNRRNLRAMVEAEGLTVIKEADISVPTIGRTIANMLGRRNSLAFILISAGLHPIQWAVEWLTRRPTAIRIVAQKA